MLAPLSSRVILTLSYVTLVFAGTYSQTESISGTGFLNSFDYQTIQDPTHGRVCVGHFTDAIYMTNPLP